MHRADIVTVDGATLAMIMATKKSIPSKQWRHKPEIRDRNKMTVAMILAMNKVKEIPRDWHHKADMQNNDGNTVAMIFAS